MTKRHKALTIQTPEGIRFSLQLASPVTRFVALALDKACVYTASTVLGSFVGVLGIVSTNVALAVWMIASFALSIGYPIAFEWFMQGQTPGKKILRLQVMDEQGLRLRFSQVVIRNVLRFLDAIPAFYLVGGLTAVLTDRCQRVGDVAANTIVIARPRLSEPDLTQLMAGKYNSFRALPHLVARLRQSVKPSEATITLQALLRRDTLDDEARLSLFAEIREHMAAKVAFPPEVTEGISDEQYIRNVADVLFR